MSLIEVVVASGILGVVMLAFAQMSSNQARETRALSEKLEMLDFQALMEKTLMDGSALLFSVTDTTLPANPGNPKSFADPLPANPSGTIAAAAQPAIPLNNLYMSALGTPPPLLATTMAANPGSPASRLGPHLRIQGITLVITDKLAPQQFKGELRVAMANGVRTNRPAFMSVVLQTNAAGQITSLSPTTGAPFRVSANAPCNGTAVATCPPGSRMITGGAYIVDAGCGGGNLDWFYSHPDAALNGWICGWDDGTGICYAVCQPL